jgi:hypothetical protein
MTIETQAHDVLHRAGDQIDVPPPPLEALLGSTARRRRVAALVAGLSAGAVVVAVAVVSSDNGAVSPPTNPAPPTTAEGTRLVGMNGVMVSVPQNWATDHVKCGTALSDTVYFDTGAVRTCRIEPRPDVSVLHVADVGRNDGALQIAQAASTPVTVGGLQALRSSRHYAQPCPQPDPCDDSYEAALYFPTLGVVFWGSSPRQGVVDPILDSAQLIPDGYVAIPVNTTGSELEAMGLHVDLADGTRSDDVAPTTPPEGSVVALGSTVTVGRGLDDMVPDTARTGLVGMNGVMVSVPQGWVTTYSHCEDSVVSAAALPNEGNSCLQLDPATVAAVYVVPIQSPYAEPWRSMNAVTGGPFGGSFRYATTSWGCAAEMPDCDTEFYAGAVSVTGSGVMVWAAGPDRDVVDDMLGSVTRIPDGLVAVPRLPTALSLADVGLNVDLPAEATETDLLETSPTPGQVVPAGSTVEVVDVQPDQLSTPPNVAPSTIHGPTIACSLKPGGTVGDVGSVWAFDVRAGHPGDVTLTLTSAGAVVGTSDPVWMFAAERTTIYVAITGAVRDSSVGLRFTHRFGDTGAEETNRDVQAPVDQTCR